MKGETTEVQDHRHEWEATLIDGEFYGKTTSGDHIHQISIPEKNCFAENAILETTECADHLHEVVIPAELLSKMKGEYAKVSLRDDEEDSPYGPDGMDEEEDEKKRRKAKVDEDGLMKDSTAKYQSMTDKPWDGSKGRFTLEQLRRAVPAAMRSWGDAQAKGGEKVKGDYKLPYKEPDGTININAVRNALARAKQVKGPGPDVINRAVSELQGVLDRAKKEGFACGDKDDKEKDYADTVTCPECGAKYAMDLEKCPECGAVNPEMEKKEFTDLQALAIQISQQYADDPDIEVIGKKVFVRNQHLFKTGVWNGHKITEKNILEMAKNFEELKGSWLPPIKAGHRTGVHMAEHGEKALGWVHNVRPALPFMDGDLEFPVDHFAHIIDPGKLRFKSIEVDPNFRRNGKEYGEVLTALAVLGVSNPALNDLGPIVRPFSDNQEDLICIEFEESGGESMTKKDENVQTPDVKKEYEDQIAALKKEYEDKIAEQKKTFEDQITKEHEAVKHFAAKLAAQDAQRVADKLKAEGKLLPRQERHFKSLYLTLSGDTVLTFSEDKVEDGKIAKDEDGNVIQVEHKLSQRDVLAQLFEGIKPQVELDKEAAQDGNQKPDTPDKDKDDSSEDEKKAFESLPKAIREYALDKGYAIADANVQAKAKKLMAENDKLDEATALTLAYSEINDK
jgi:hypothetical protein